jgi:hypothetical protein
MEPGRTGVDFSNRVGPRRRLENQLLTHGAGVAIGDVDGDGLPDLFLGRVDGPSALYRNLGGWRFEDVTSQAGVALEGKDVTGVALADVDGDGDLDLLAGARGQPNALLVNDGTGRFTDVSVERGMDDPGGATTLALADVDGDGDLDVYVTNYKRTKVGTEFPPQARSFDQVVKFRDGEYQVEPEFREFYRAYEEPEGIRLWQYGEADLLLLNDGTGTFEAAEWTGGRFLMETGAVLDSIPEEWGLSARFHDVNGDGAPDLYVANDFESPDQFWINQGDGRFRALGPLALRTTSASSMAVDFSDVDRNGRSDFLLLDMLARDPVRRRTQMPTIAPTPVGPGEVTPRLQRNRNTFFRARPDGTFAEVAHAAGLEASGWSWGAMFLDADLDGYEDVLITTGHAWDVLDADMNERLTNSFVDDDWRSVVNNFPSLELPNVAFRNRGDGTFQEVGSAWGVDLGPDIAHGLASGDFDLDGDLDVVMTRLGAPVALLRNDAVAPRVAVRLVGPDGNTAGVGALVRLRGGAVEQTKEISAGGLYLSSAEPLASFAAEGDSLVLEVEWPWGGTSVVEGVTAGRLYEIRADRRGGPGVEGAAEEGASALFRGMALPWTHGERPFNDFQRQPLLPHRLSQFGPGITLDDVDGDGDPDLLVPSGAGGRLGVLVNRGGEFDQVLDGPEAVTFDQTAILPLPGVGGTRYLVGQSNHQATRPEQARTLPGGFWLDVDGSVPRDQGAAIPPAIPSVGGMAASDLDGDGSLEVLVASRAFPAAYPQPAPSRFFRLREGVLEPDEGLSQSVASAGLISGMVFADLDGDGDDDLALAVDWGPVRIYTNHLGRLTETTGDMGLGELRGRWNGVNAGDFDGDGDLDLVVTSWGGNLEYRPTPDRPLRLYWGDFDGQGAMDLLMTSMDEDGREWPEMDLARLSQAVPTIRTEHVRTFDEFASAPLREIVGPEILSGLRREEAVTLEHHLLVNEGGRFTPRPLPAVAQEAPAFHPAVGDLDGDGNEDVLLAQNFFPNQVDAQRYAAGRGLLLLGDGAGGFTSVPGSRSGVRIYGDQRGAALADVDGDHRLDVVVGQNGGPPVLLRNRTADPGLSVRIQGPPGNPRGAGVQIRVEYEDGSLGPVRQVRLGAGYWSVDGAVQVLGLSGEPAALQVLWPGGTRDRVPVEGARTVTVGWRP